MASRFGIEVIGILVDPVRVKTKLVYSSIVEKVVYATMLEASMVDAVERVDAMYYRIPDF